MPIFGAALRLKHLTSIPTPPNGEVSFYSKTDGGLYLKNSLGVERPLIQQDSALHANPSYETGTTAPGDGWNVFWSHGNGAGLWSWDTTTAIDGVRSLKGTFGASMNTWLHTSATFAVVAGSTIEVSLWCKTSVAGNMLIRLMTSTAAGNPDFFGSELTEQNYNATVGTTWTRISAQFTIPPGHTKARIFFAGADNRSWWYDATGSKVTQQAPVSDDTGWITPTFENNWVSYGGAYPALYRRLNGVVFIRGLVRFGTVGASPIFTLPAGFRPYGYSIFNTRTDGNPGICYLEVTTGGAVMPVQATSNNWVSLEVSFPADN